MHRTILVVLCAVLGAGTVTARAAEPVRATVASYESVTLMTQQFSPQGPGALTMWDGYLSVTTTASGTLTTGGLTPAVDIKANGRWNVCQPGWVNCSTFDIPQQIVSPTAMFTDPVANTVRVTAQVHDLANAMHNVDLTFSRPTTPFYPNVGTPNAWVDTATDTVHADTWLAFYRGGYQVVGTIDGFTFTPVLAGCQINCNYYVTSTYGRFINPSVTLND